MRSSSRAKSAGKRIAVAAAKDPDVIYGPEALDSAFGFVRRHLVVVLVSLLVAYGVWAAYAVFVTSDFVATAKVLVDSRGAAQLAQQQPLAAVDTDELPTQVDLLKSGNVARKVIKDLNLTQDPELAQPTLPAWLTAAAGRLYPLVDRSAWLTAAADRLYPPVDQSAELMRRTLNAFRRRLKISSVPSSHLIDVSYRSSDPKRSALIANAAAKALIELDLNAKYGAVEQATAWSQKRLADLRAQMEDAQKGMVEFRGGNNINAQIVLYDLQGRIQMLRSVYNNVLRQQTEAAQRQSFPIAESQVVAAAVEPLENDRLNSALAFAIVTLVGASAGLGIGAIRDIRDRTFRTGEQLEAGLGLECIAMLPKLKRGSSLARLYSDRLEQSNALVDSSNDSQFVEALRSIELAARLNGSKKAIMIGITSALPGEGKSTLAAALAFHLAQRSGRVLLVDCDLRNAYLSRTICPQASCGLTEMARGTVSREDAVRNRQTGQTDNMNFLPARSEISGWTNDEVVDSDTMREVFETLRRQYDVILIDLPPLAPVVDARAVADLVDAYVLVVEWGKTNSDVVQHALRSARLVRDKLIGAVLNKVDFSSMRRYDRHLTQYYGDYFKDRRAALH